MTSARITRRDAGFTLIELLIAFAFVAMATVSILSLLRSSMRNLAMAQQLSVASQAMSTPAASDKQLGIRRREVSSEIIAAGPMQIQRDIVEIIPDGQTDGFRVKTYP